jgi:hypothetical protein
MKPPDLTKNKTPLTRKVVPVLRAGIIGDDYHRFGRQVFEFSQSEAKRRVYQKREGIGKRRVGALQKVRHFVPQGVVAAADTQLLANVFKLYIWHCRPPQLVMT